MDSTKVMAHRWRPPVGEVVLAAAFAVVGVLLTVGLVSDGGVAAALAVTVAHSAPLAWRRRHPEAVLALMGLTAAVAASGGWPVVILGPAVLAGVHGLGTTRDRDRALPVLGITVAVMAAVVVASGMSAETVVTNAVGLGVAWWLGDRQRGASQRAERAEREAEVRARQAVADERLRIARELHDVVAHALSVIAVQAGTGRVVLDGDPETARSSLMSIESESRSALGEMRRLLDVLRADDEDRSGPLTPSPGLDDLETLVVATVRTGLPVEVRIEGERGPRPAGAELAAYRIVQEALTNVRRHASATRAEVRLCWRPDAIDLEVLDDGRGTGTVGTRDGGVGGNGVVGMRERAALYGGTLEAGNRPGGGYRVAAHIPCPQAVNR